MYNLMVNGHTYSCKETFWGKDQKIKNYIYFFSVRKEEYAGIDKEWMDLHLEASHPHTQTETCTHTHALTTLSPCLKLDTSQKMRKHKEENTRE